MDTSEFLRPTDFFGPRRSASRYQQQQQQPQSMQQQGMGGGPGRFYGGQMTPYMGGFGSGGNLFDTLNRELNNIERQFQPSDISGANAESFNKTTYTTVDQEGRTRSKEVSRYRNPDGKEIVKERKVLGDRVHEVIRREDGSTQDNLNLEEAQRFESEWNKGSQFPSVKAGEQQPQLQDQQRLASIHNLKSQMSQLQDQIARLESSQSQISRLDSRQQKQDSQLKQDAQQ